MGYCLATRYFYIFVFDWYTYNPDYVYGIIKKYQTFNCDQACK